MKKNTTTQPTTPVTFTVFTTKTGHTLKVYDSDNRLVIVSYYTAKAEASKTKGTTSTYISKLIASKFAKQPGVNPKPDLEKHPDEFTHLAHLAMAKHTHPSAVEALIKAVYTDAVIESATEEPKRVLLEPKKKETKEEKDEAPETVEVEIHA